MPCRFRASTPALLATLLVLAVAARAPLSSAEPATAARQREWVQSLAYQAVRIRDLASRLGFALTDLGLATPDAVDAVWSRFRMDVVAYRERVAADANDGATFADIAPRGSAIEHGLGQLAPRVEGLPFLLRDHPDVADDPAVRAYFGILGRYMRESLAILAAGRLLDEGAADEIRHRDECLMQIIDLDRQLQKAAATYPHLPPDEQLLATFLTFCRVQRERVAAEVVAPTFGPAEAARCERRRLEIETWNDLLQCADATAQVMPAGPATPAPADQALSAAAREFTAALRAALAIGAGPDPEPALLERITAARLACAPLKAAWESRLQAAQANAERRERRRGIDALLAQCDPGIRQELQSRLEAVERDAAAAASDLDAAQAAGDRVAKANAEARAALAGVQLAQVARAADQEAACARLVAAWRGHEQEPAIAAMIAEWARAHATMVAARAAHDAHEVLAQRIESRIVALQVKRELIEARGSELSGAGSDAVNEVMLRGERIGKEVERPTQGEKDAKAAEVIPVSAPGDESF